MYRTGIGFDAHRFSSETKLILGGVEIPFEFGLEGHSDADVLTHAICDAMLGAVGERDIGTHFPDNELEYRGISSLALLKDILILVGSKGYRVENIDTVIVCEKPRLQPYISQIKRSIATAIKIPEDALGVKATTTDSMGFTGRGEGVAAYAVALLKK